MIVQQDINCTAARTNGEKFNLAGEGLVVVSSPPVGACIALDDINNAKIPIARGTRIMSPFRRFFLFHHTAWPGTMRLALLGSPSDSVSWYDSPELRATQAGVEYTSNAAKYWRADIFNSDAKDVTGRVLRIKSITVSLLDAAPSTVTLRLGLYLPYATYGGTINVGSVLQTGGDGIISCPLSIEYGDTNLPPNVTHANWRIYLDTTAQPQLRLPVDLRLEPQQKITVEADAVGAHKIHVAADGFVDGVDQ